MFNNAARRSGGGQSLNKVNLVVAQAVTTGQDLFISEAGDIAPSEWFTGSAVFLDNTTSNLYGKGYNITSGDVASLNDQVVYVAYLIATVGAVPAQIAIRKVNPITGELLNSFNIAVTADSLNGQKCNVQVIPISDTAVGVVLSGMDQANSRYCTRCIKFTTSGATFTATSWSTSLYTNGVVYNDNVLYFQGVSGTANRIGFLIKPVTSTTAVCIIYTPATNAMTTVSLSYANTTFMVNATWCMLEGTDTVVALEGSQSSCNIRYIHGTAATGTSSSLNLGTHANSYIQAMISTSGTKLIATATTTNAGTYIKSNTKIICLNLSADLLTFTLGNVYTLDPKYAGFGDGPYCVAMYAAGKLYLSPSQLISEYINQPYDSTLSSVLTAGQANGRLVELNATAATVDVTNVKFLNAPLAVHVDLRRWEPIETRKLRCIYTSYYRTCSGRSGFTTNMDNSDLVGDVPLLFMPDFGYAVARNGLAYVGSANSAAAKDAAVDITLGLGAVRLNTNLAPAKAIKNGVIALNANWGVKFPKGQRNEGTLNYTQQALTQGTVYESAAAGTNLVGYASEGMFLELKNSCGTIDIIVEGTSQNNESSGSNLCNIVAIVDGRPLSVTAMTKYINQGSLTKGSLVFSIPFNDYLVFAYTPGSDYTNQDIVIREIVARANVAKLEDKYYE